MWVIAKDKQMKLFCNKTHDDYGALDDAALFNSLEEAKDEIWKGAMKGEIPVEVNVSAIIKIEILK